MNLTLATQNQFNSVLCDFWQNEKGEIFMTRDQIGQALEYSDPRTAIAKLHERHAKRIDPFSTVTKLTTVDGRQREAVIYNAKGIYEICRWSKQPKADAFYDWVYDLLENLRNGELLVLKSQSVDTELEIKRMRAEAMLNNSRTRQAKLILDMQKNKILSPVAVELLQVNVLEVLSDQTIDYRPEVKKTYTASDIGSELGISPQKVGSIANKHNLKTDEYGYFALDKSPYSNKQVESFRYYEKGRQKIQEIVQGKLVN
ncbi:hypothetical protein LYSIN_01024 [Lysinibacillus sphaericus]|uniref:Bro-N domain-containing protein n=1 Tax=Lysinibacillus sphaericus TaxID=1421 RepID=A0A2S5CZK7_LYSSH|nr:BRO family protein [Lysinibacillus sphaericus]POZ56241.1 hypothetical protein LYSIN_01024 [Lysinibacillus sphaericus]